LDLGCRTRDRFESFKRKERVWNPEGLHIRSVQTIELMLVSVVAYLIAAAQLTTEGEPLKRLQKKPSAKIR